MAKAKTANYAAIKQSYSGSESETYVIQDTCSKMYLNMSLKLTPYTDGNTLVCESKEEADVITRVLNKNSMANTVRMIQKICCLKRYAEDKTPYNELLCIATGENLKHT